MSRRHATENHCPRCRLVVLSGLDNDRCALDARVDPWPIDRVTEVLALLAGRRTYEAVRYEGRIELYHRSVDRQGRPGTQVLVEHRCGEPLPACGNAVTQKPVFAPLPDEPPF